MAGSSTVSLRTEEKHGSGPFVQLPEGAGLQVPRKKSLGHPPRLSKTLVGILGSGMSDRAGIYMTLLLVWPISLNIHHFPRSGGPFPRTFTTFQGLVAHFLEHSPLSKVWRPISKQQEAQEGRASPQGPYLLIGPGWPLRAKSVGPGHPFAS